MTPGRKFSTTTSAVATSRRAAATASSRFKSSTTLFLPVLSWPKEVLAPLRKGGRDRIMSPSGDSILITSAPRSASSRVQCGPAIVVVKSTTRMPARASVFIGLPSQQNHHHAADHEDRAAELAQARALVQHVAAGEK